MAAKDLGTKYTCFKCGARFYDLKKPEPLCPKCGADQRESPALRAPEKGERRRARPAAVVEETPAEEEATDEAAEEEDEADEIPAADDDY